MSLQVDFDDLKAAVESTGGKVEFGDAQMRGSVVLKWKKEDREVAYELFAHLKKLAKRGAPIRAVYRPEKDGTYVTFQKV
jgi:hypothetical protein